MSEKRKVIVDDEEYNVELEKKGSSWKVKIRNREFTVKIEGDKNKSIKENKKRKKTKIGNGTISSSIPGKIISVNIDIGDLVNEGDVLVILEAMKMQNSLRAERTGVVKAVHTNVGSSLGDGDILVEFETENDAK